MFPPSPHHKSYYTPLRTQNLQPRPTNNIMTQLKRFLPFSSGNSLLTNPNNVSNVITNIQQVLKVVETTAPLVKQYGPMVKNIPAMIKMVKAFKEIENVEDTTGEIESTDNATISNTKTPKATTTSKEEQIHEKRKTGISTPKLFI